MLDGIWSITIMQKRKSSGSLFPSFTKSSKEKRISSSSSQEEPQSKKLKTIDSFFKKPNKENIDPQSQSSKEVSTPVKQETFFSSQSNSQSNSQLSQSLEESSSQTSTSSPTSPFLKHYYLNDFTKMLSTVEEKDFHLLHSREKEFLASFKNCSEQAQRLFVRIYNRKGPWFCSTDLKQKYTEELSLIANSSSPQQQASQQDSISSQTSSSSQVGSNANLMEWLDELASAQLIEFSNAQTHEITEGLLNLLSTDQLKVLYKKLNRILTNVTVSKPELMQRIINKNYDAQNQESKQQKSMLSFVVVTKQIDEEKEKAKAISYRQTILDFIIQERKCEKLLKLTDLAAESLKIFHLLCFLGQETDSKGTILETMGITKFPEYEFKPTSMFDTRDDLDKYQIALDFRRKLYAEDGRPLNTLFESEIQEIASKFAAEIAIFKTRKVDHFRIRYTSGWIYAKILSEYVSILETQKMYDTATLYLRDLLESPFCTYKRGGWYNRLALDLEHMKNKQDALSVCEQALMDPFLRTHDRLTIEKRTDRLCKATKAVKSPNNKLNLHQTIQKATDMYIRGKYPTGFQPERSKKSIFLSYDKITNAYVEQLALEFYHMKYSYTGGVHCEGSIFASMYSLLFWDIIYDSSVPFVFQNKYQHVPLDYATDAFYESRKEKIIERLKQIEASMDFVLEKIDTVVSKNNGVQSIVNWKEINLDQLKSIALCVGGKGLAAILKVFAEDQTKSRSGFPDVIMYFECFKNGQRILESFPTKSDQGNVIPAPALFSEVKGPRDKLSDKQYIWIDILLAANCCVHVCHIVEAMNCKGDQVFDDNEFFSE